MLPSVQTNMRHINLKTQICTSYVNRYAYMYIHSTDFRAISTSTVTMKRSLYTEFTYCEMSRNKYRCLIILANRINWFPYQRSSWIFHHHIPTHQAYYTFWLYVWLFNGIYSSSFKFILQRNVNQNLRWIALSSMRNINMKINLLSRGFNYSCTEIGNILKWKYILWLLAYIPHKGFYTPTI